MKRIGAVVVSYNSAADLKKCVESFTSQSSADLHLETCVIDNYSSDKSVVEANKLKMCHVIANDTNTGFSVAVNQGLRYFIDQDFDYYIILNPDAIMQPGSVMNMLNAFNSDKDIAAVGPRMLHSDGSDATDGYYLKAPTLLTVAAFSTFLRPHALKNSYLVNRYQEQLGDKSQLVEQIPGACIFTSKEKLESIGLLSEEFAIWFEDVEWSYRARKKGYKLLFDVESSVVHDGGVSFSKWNDLNKAVTFYVSMKTFFRIHKPISYPFVVLTIMLNSFALFVKNKDRSNLEFIKRFMRLKKGVLPKN